MSVSYSVPGNVFCVGVCVECKANIFMLMSICILSTLASC
jgi:hypothetical protein